MEEWRSGGVEERKGSEEWRSEGQGVRKPRVLTEILQPSKTTFQLLAKLHRSIQQLSIPAFLPNNTTACTGEDELEGDYNCTLTFQLGTTRTFVSQRPSILKLRIGPCAHIPPQSREQLLTQVSDVLLSGILSCPLQDSAHCIINILTALKIFRRL